MYATLIREDLAATGNSDIAPHLVEAWMRLEHGTLDALSPKQFRREVLMAVACVRQAPEESVSLAESFGLKAR
jgi:hypothetical protein